jgi:dephospho-CoA kinase
VKQPKAQWIGLTGGIGSGKSAVSNIFKNQGIPVLDADEAARHVLKNGSPLLTKIRRIFGARHFDRNGNLNRLSLAAHVFENKTALKKINTLLHPPILEHIKKQARKVKDGKKVPFIVFDVALLFESGFDQEMDQSIVVWAPQKIRIARLKKGRGYSRREALNRIKNQWPLRDKCRRADYIIDNSGSRAATKSQTIKLIQQLSQTPCPDL